MEYKNEYLSLLKKEIKQSVWTGYVTYYPHKIAYSPMDDVDMQKMWQGVKELNLYVHIPFCNQKCAYCNLFSTVLTEDEKQNFYEKYVLKLLEEIDFYKKYIDKNVLIKSLYFGGGTPTVLSVEQIGRIIKKFKLAFKNWDKSIEICIESAPDTLSKEYMQGLFNLGIRRISTGVQSFVEKELEKVNRKTNISHIYDIRKWALEIGLNINFDLIYGLPYQTEQTIMENVDKVIELSPESICMYPLAVRKYTGLDGIDKKLIFTMEQKYKIYDKIREKLEKNCYKCQTIVRFVKNNNSTYQQQRYEYQGVATLGIGAGARSYSEYASMCITYKVQDRLVKNIIDEYMRLDAKSRKFVGFKYNEDEVKRRFIMLSMLDPGISGIDYKKKFGSDLLFDFKEQFEALFSLKMLEKQNNLFVLTRKGRKYCDDCADLFVSENVKELYSKYRAE